MAVCTDSSHTYVQYKGKRENKRCAVRLVWAGLCTILLLNVHTYSDCLHNSNHWLSSRTIMEKNNYGKFHRGKTIPIWPKPHYEWEKYNYGKKRTEIGKWSEKRIVKSFLWLHTLSGKTQLWKIHRQQSSCGIWSFIFSIILSVTIILK